MKITPIACEGNSISAVFTWEDTSRGDDVIQVEFDPAPSRWDSASIAACWITSGAIVAQWLGERRVALDLAVCPELLDNLRNSLAWLGHWYHGDHDIPHIETDVSATPHTTSSFRTAGLFFSAGVDSMWTLRHNATSFGRDDARRHTLGFTVRGFEVHDEAAFSVALGHIRHAAERLGIHTVAVRTNLYSTFRQLDPNIDFLVSSFEGAFFAALAHAYGHGLARVDIATTLHLPYMAPNGCHPSLQYSSGALQVRFDGLRHSRLDKIRDLITWPEACSRLRVCNRVGESHAKRINCGCCNKCVGTMLGLRASGLVPSICCVSRSGSPPGCCTDASAPTIRGAAGLQ